MRTTITPDGQLSIHIGDLLGQLPDAHKVSLIDTLSCEDAVIKHVTDQLLDGWTEYSSCGAVSWIAEAEPRRPLDQARRRIAMGASDTAADEIRRLTEALAQAEARVAELEEDHRNAWAKARQHW